LDFEARSQRFSARVGGTFPLMLPCIYTYRVLESASLAMLSDTLLTSAQDCGQVADYRKVWVSTVFGAG
jgi:hypothetical protein